MSYDVAMTFREKILDDQALKKQAEVIWKSGKPAEVASDFVALGHKHGYEFSEEDVKKVVTTISADKAAMNEFELDMVAGGCGNTFNNLVDYTGTGCASGGTGDFGAGNNAYIPPLPPGSSPPPQGT